MINSVTSTSATTQAAAQARNSPPNAPRPANPAQDTVHLSPQALAAAGDVDHDGDSA
jgi:hypothetical protein